MSDTPAANNRTLRLDDGERSRLRPRLLDVAGLAAGADCQDRTICGDLLDVLPLLPDAMAHLIIVDPPYNLTKRFGGQTFAARTDDSYRAYLRSWFHALCRKLRPDGSLYICGDWKSTAALQEVVSDELTILNRITWQREKGRGAKRNWKNAMEDIWFAVKSEKSYYFDVDSVKMRRRVLAPYREDGKAKDWDDTAAGKFRTTCPSNFWDDISVPFWSMPENTDHPTQKPEKLFAKLILASSRPGDIVLDPFLGSGTTSVVAKKLGRHYCGIEIEEEYCLLAERRLELADMAPTIQGYSDGVFWERNTLAAQQAAHKRQAGRAEKRTSLF